MNSQCYSAQVKMELRLNDQVLPVAALGPEFLVLRQLIDHPPADGEIYVRIDASEDTWRVRLPEGISMERRKTRIEPLPQWGVEPVAV